MRQPDLTPARLTIPTTFLRTAELDLRRTRNLRRDIHGRTCAQLPEHRMMLSNFVTGSPHCLMNRFLSTHVSGCKRKPKMGAASYG